jgi:hypothetical protein
LRFNGPELGAWYAADDIRTAAAEVGHHLRRETVARSIATMTRTYRAYTATVLGDYLDIRGQQATRPDVYASERYDASQRLGEEVRASGGAGLLYDSLRRQPGVNVVAHRPHSITDIVQIISKLRCSQRRAGSTFANCRFDKTADRRYRRGDRGRILQRHIRRHFSDIAAFSQCPHCARCGH